MKNIITRSIGSLADRGNKAIAGMTLYAVQLTLPNSNAANLPEKVNAMSLADTDHKAAVGELKTRRLALNGARREAIDYLRVVRELLRPRLGRSYSQAWDVTGLTRTLGIPGTEEELLRVLYSMQAYLASSPIANGGTSVSAARAEELHDALAAASAALVQQQDAVGQALKNRDDKTKAVEFALRVLLSELHKALTPIDPRWLAFGFNKPGARATPAMPLNVVATLIGSNGISIKWDSSARAEYYRVWKKVIGVDEDYVAMGSPADLDFTLLGLPGNSQVEIVIAAVNNGGESVRTEPLVVQTL